MSNFAHQAFYFLEGVSSIVVSISILFLLIAFVAIGMNFLHEILHKDKES